jgi:peptidoglycan/LPS O-acetylase OafA/YrhL
VHRLWKQPWLIVLGQRSYSLYLWHVPIFLLVAQHLGDRPVWFRLVAGVVPVAIITELSYRFVENRYRHFR